MRRRQRIVRGPLGRGIGGHLDPKEGEEDDAQASGEDKAQAYQRETQHHRSRFLEGLRIIIYSRGEKSKTILSFVGILAGLGVGVNGGSYVSGMILVLGVFLGSSLWWLMFSGGVDVLRIRATPQILRWINRISGAIIVGFSLWALSGLLP